MRIRHAVSEEVVPTNDVKFSEYLRRNPRLPKKMRPVKAKPSNSSVRTIGQVSGHGRNLLSSNLFGIHNMSGEPARRVSDHEYTATWSELHRSYSNSLATPRSLIEDFAENKSHFCNVTAEKDEPQPESTMSCGDKVIPPRTTDSGVQVNMFHCLDCRRHLMYGKSFKLENSCGGSDSENHNISSITCSNCECEEPDVKGDTDRKPNYLPNAPQAGNFHAMLQRSKKFLWLFDNIKFMTIALLIIPLIFYLMQLQVFTSAIKHLLGHQVEEEPHKSIRCTTNGKVLLQLRKYDNRSALVEKIKKALLLRVPFENSNLGLPRRCGTLTDSTEAITKAIPEIQNADSMKVWLTKPNKSEQCMAFAEM
ncbi:uncharacterized protein LOC128997527 [Macrosteles quadrilineatus]|uniref:uncharacterized protein LOC128997527 n=1 Tax=Macrosteles quadrilineatus TaxID=74068 RepID=UPI0023E1A137|nr:uncharacterized protein LOC128997527 [Macrosteles quadrilineatus]